MGNNKDNTKGIGLPNHSSMLGAKPRKNHIFAIAIDDYTNGPPPLKHPVAECERLIQLLVDKYEFEERHIISRLYNEKATQENLYDELYYLKDKLNEEHNLVLIFSGHGYLDSKGIEEGYWLPVDAPNRIKPNDTLKFISLDHVLKILAKVRAHHITLIVDSCFAGRFAQGSLEFPDIEQFDRNNPQEFPSRWVLTSGRWEEVLDKSPFAEATYEILERNGKSALSLQEIYTTIRDRLKEKKVKQTPQCSDIMEAKYRGGEFYFQLRQANTQSDASAVPAAIDQAELIQNLRQGSRKYLDLLKKGRFVKLQFEKILLPETESELLDIDVHLEEEKTPLRQALEQLWARKAKGSIESPNTLLCGEGGMSKTVSCVRLWEELLEDHENYPLPIFIPLNEYNAAAEKERESQKFLYQFIAREYLDDARLTPDLEDALKQLFKAESNQPKVLLMLDGFNEISVEKRALMVELINFVRRSQGTQIVVTSRYEMRNFEWTQGFNRLDLVALRPEQIKDYLIEKKLHLPKQADVQQLLQNPMMLTLFAGTSQLAEQFEKDNRFSFKPKVSSKGELLHNFIEGQLAKYWADNTRNAQRDEEFVWQAFLLRHLLPFLAWRMVEEGRFFIHTRKSLDPAFNFKSVVEEAYQHFHSFDFTDLFPEFEGHRQVLGFGIPEKDYDGIETRNKRIRKYALEKLFQLVEEDDTFRFLHQNFRDYFAAIHVQQTMKVAVAHNQGIPEDERRFPETLRKAPLDFFVRHLLGELEGEHTNQINYDEKKGWHWSAGQFFLENNLASLLETCRGVFDLDRLGYTVWNILTILKEKREDFSGADLQHLNLKRLSFNEYPCSHPGLYASFCHSLLDKSCVFSQGHSDEIISASFHPNGFLIVTASNDHTIKIWDSNTGECIRTFVGHSKGVWSAVFNFDGSKIVSASYDETARVWDSNTGKCSLILKGHFKRLWSAAFSIDSEKVITASEDKTAKVWDIKTGECQLTLKGHSAGIKSVSIHPNGSERLCCMNHFQKRPKRA